MTTFLIFIALMVGFYIIRNLIRQNKYKNMHNDVMDEIRKENPNYDNEVKAAMQGVQERLRRQELYLKAMEKKGYEVGFGWQELCNDDENWKKLGPEINQILNE